MSEGSELGCVRLEPSDPVAAGSRGTWRLIYTVGSRGIALGGGLRIMPPHQGKTIWEVGKVIATASRPGVSCEVAVDNVYPQTYHWRRPSAVFVTVQGARLEPDDEIVVTLGERGDYVSGYFRRAKAPEIAVPHAWFEVWVDTEGNASYIVPPRGGDGYQRLEEVPALDVVGGEPDHFAAIARQPARSGEPWRMLICARDRYDNRAENYCGSPQYDPEDAAAAADFDQQAAGSVEVEVTGGIPSGQRITVYDPVQELIGTSNPICPNFAEPYNIYFGDLHVMTGRGNPYEGQGSDHPTSYRYARDVEGLDFAVVTIGAPNQEVWEQDLAGDAEFNDAHRFVTFPAIELYFKTGHKNVYFPVPDPPLLKAGSAEELWEVIGDTECMVIPHHPNCHSESVPRTGWGTYDFDSINPRYERLIEICQNRGSFEVDEIGGAVYLGGYGSSVQDALARGLRLGFVGGTDTHVGLAGEHRSALGGLDPEEVVMGGFTAILAEELTRESLWEALQVRRCYATLASHILLSVKLNGHWMGAELTEAQVGPERNLEIKVAGARELESVEIVRNNETVARFDCDGVLFEETWTDAEPLAQIPKLGDRKTVFYYVRVTQRDRRLAWSSPIWVEAE